VFELKIEYHLCPPAEPIPGLTHTAVRKITVCCDEMSQALLLQAVAIETRPFRGECYLPFLTVGQPARWVKFCPFCGKPIEVEEVE
jgi:hypothetical protein